MAIVSKAIKNAEGFAGTETMLMLNPAVIEFNPRNPRLRFDTKEDKELLAYIAQGHTVPPLLVRIVDGKFQVVDGGRRLTAYKTLLEQNVEVPAIACELTDESDEIALMFECLNRNEGKPLNQVELADAYSALIADGLSAKDISVGVNKTQAHVSQILTFSRASKSIKNMVLQGKITFTEAVEAVRKGEAESPATNAKKPAPAKSKPTTSVEEQEEEEDVDVDEEPMSMEEVAAQLEQSRAKAKESKKEIATAVKEAKEEGVSLSREEKQMAALLASHGPDGVMAIVVKAATVTLKTLDKKDTKSRKKWTRYLELLELALEVISEELAGE